MTVKELKRQINVPLLTKRFIVYDLFKVVGISGVVLLVLLIGISLVAPGKFDLETVLAWARQSGETGAQNHFGMRWPRLRHDFD